MSKYTWIGWYQMLLQYLQQQGYDCKFIHAQAGINDAESKLTEAKLTEAKLTETGATGATPTAIAQDDMTRLWNAALEMTRDPTLGLKVGSHFRPGAMGIVSWAMMSNETVGDSINLLLHHQHVLADALDFSLNKHEQHVEIVLNNIGDRLPASPLSIDASIMSFFTFFRWLTQGNFHFSSVYLSRPELPLKEDYQQLLDCRFRLQEGHNSVWIKSSELSTRLITADPQTHQLHLQHLADFAKEKSQGDFRSMVVALIRQHLGQDDCNVEFIARKLHVSKSTMLRNLKAEQCNFQMLLDKTRAHMAISLLRHSTQSLEQIAGAVGFSSANSFCRSFKRLTGNSPGDYRR